MDVYSANCAIGGGRVFLEDFGRSQEFAKLKYGANDWYVVGS